MIKGPDGEDHPDDNEQPSARSSEVDPRDARRYVQRPEERGGDPGTDLESNAGQSISQFLRFYPCTRFFVVMADRQYDAEMAPEHRVQLLRERDPKIYMLCVITDYLLILVAALGILTAAGVVIYKSVWL